MRHVPHWLRERTAEERAWERAWLRSMQALERLATEFGWRLRP